MQIYINNNLIHYLKILLAGFLFVWSSCSKSKINEDDLLIKSQDRILTRQEVIDLIPSGIHPNDSIAMFRAIVESWIKDAVLTDFAEDRLYDLSPINRRVMEYRSKLIVGEYLRRMRESITPDITEDRVRKYYDEHSKELITEVPLVKGVFIKVGSSAYGREEIGKLLKSESDANIDLLEKNWLDIAITYEYFKDKWIDWETVSELIPYRFPQADSFLAENNYFETEYGDCAYYLLITDYLPSGSVQPYDFASSWIKGMLSRRDLADYEQSLVNSLIKKSLEEHKLEYIGYNPEEYEITQN